MAPLMAEPIKSAVEVVIGASAGLMAGMRVAPQTLPAIILTAVVLGAKVFQATYLATVVPYRTMWANRVLLIIVVIEAICGALLLQSQMQPSKAVTNAVSERMLALHACFQEQSGSCALELGGFHACERAS